MVYRKDQARHRGERSADEDTATRRVRPRYDADKEPETEKGPRTMRSRLSEDVARTDAPGTRYERERREALQEETFRPEGRPRYAEEERGGRSREPDEDTLERTSGRAMRPARGPRSGGADASRAGTGRSRRGFAAMNPDAQREIARRGGEAVQLSGRAYALSREEAQRGGQARRGAARDEFGRFQAPQGRGRARGRR